MKLRELAEQAMELDPHCSCGHRFQPKDVRCRNHPDGIPLGEYDERQWVYFHCPACSYDTSLVKLTPRREALAAHPMTDPHFEANTTPAYQGERPT